MMASAAAPQIVSPWRGATLAFGVAAACFAGAWLLVHRHVNFERA